MGKIRSGKVRDIYRYNDENILIKTSDRVSAYDHVLEDEIPGKGVILNAISGFWFNKLSGLVRNHIKYVGIGYSIVEKAEVIPVECIVRGYIAGGGWEEYKSKGSVCGIELKEGLKESGKLDQAIFTPSTKSESGHDENITYEEMERIVGDDNVSSRMREISIMIYNVAREYAYDRGMIIADTKLEFGIVDGELVLIDEVLTPDSSRIWDRDTYEEGKSQDSYDKQIIRDYLITAGFDKETLPIPRLTEEIIEKTLERYKSVYEKLTDLNCDDILNKRLKKLIVEPTLTNE